MSVWRRGLGLALETTAEPAGAPQALGVHLQPRAVPTHTDRELGSLGISRSPGRPSTSEGQKLRTNGFPTPCRKVLTRTSRGSSEGLQQDCAPTARRSGPCTSALFTDFHPLLTSPPLSSCFLGAPPPQGNYLHPPKSLSQELLWGELENKANAKPSRVWKTETRMCLGGPPGGEGEIRPLQRLVKIFQKKTTDSQGPPQTW